ncbi:ribonuclease H-like protein [Artomyces pyxidatus]|uniref:Ribonuclease H-like protein n=1 Tax=Artomyces pyxidatus TaxID=48021 RepID=A0ACB8T641_9AGAM|nr:ribonuclease H-like protein [Artomyces pyxidatus]
MLPVLGNATSRYNYTEFNPNATLLYITTEEEANAKVQELRGPLGFDLEWPYDTVTKATSRASLVQLCDSNIILLIHVSRMQNFPQKVRELIESTEIMKLGVCIRRDGAKLFRDFGIMASNLVELGKLAFQVDARCPAVFSQGPIVTLLRLVKFYVGRDLYKGPEIRASSWDQDLHREQLDYAANDAHCALMIYEKILANPQARPYSPAGYTYDIPKELVAVPRAPVNTYTPIWSPRTSQEHICPLTEQQLRAYTLWQSGYGLQGVCVTMKSREDPLDECMAINYIMDALEHNPSLPFLMSNLQEMRQMNFDAFPWKSVNDERMKRWERQKRGSAE